jgi:hypothetical protein
MRELAMLGEETMNKKTVWALVSMDIHVEEGEEGYDDESLMDIINEELVAYGFIVDDMGMRDKQEEGEA